MNKYVLVRVLVIDDACKYLYSNWQQVLYAYSNLRVCIDVSYANEKKEEWRKHKTII